MREKFRRGMARTINAVERIFFPPRCVICDELLEPGQKGIHPACEKYLLPVKGPACMHCGRPVAAEYIEFCFDCSRNGKRDSFFRQGKSCFLYQGEIKTSMYRFKYSNRREYADYFAEKALQEYGSWLQKIKPDVIFPVPMYGPKKRRRGYNQAEVFAKALSERTGIQMSANSMFRVKDTTPQKLLNDTERKNNLKNAFQTSKNIVKYNKVLLVDDIYTTGSTAEAVSECLSRNGITDIYFMSICIGKGN